MKKLNKKIKLMTSLAVAAVMTCSFGSGIFASADGSATTPVFGNYYSSDYDTRNEVEETGKKLNEEIYGEGVVLLKNENDALPLGQNAKITLLGKNSSNIIYGGSGSGAGGGGNTVDIKDALSSEGFDVNPALVNFYRDNAKSGSGRGTAPSNGTVTAGYNTGETPANMYTDEVKQSFAEYNDAAVIVISRIAGEGFDLPRTMAWDGESYARWTANSTQLVPGARSVDDHYLQLDKNEADLIKMAGENFQKVIVLFNTGSQFETGFLDDAGHYGYHANTKAALWIGYPGGSGLTALAKVLKGDINPSGRTVDTWARDFKKDPVWANFANNMVEIDSEHKGNKYVNLTSSGGNGGGGYRGNYVIYKEGIYMGYRYYETRGFDEGTEEYSASGDAAINGTATTTWNSWYDAHVVYPYGYGLSYSTFTQEIIESIPAAGSALDENGTVTLKVKVTNTGNFAGKDVVQLYYTAPYYENGVEKSHVVLGAFDKTKLLAPQESQILEITFNVRDMSSYDWSDANKNLFSGYELEHGTYSVRVMNNSHDEIDKVDFTVGDDVKYEFSEVNSYKIENRFDKISNYLDEVSGGSEKYLSRADWSGTFPTTAFRLTAAQWIQDGLNEWDDRAADADEGKPYYTDEMPTTGANNGIKLNELVGATYDDPKWDDFLDQLTAEQLTSLACQGGYASGLNNSALGITRGINADGPAGFSVGAPGGSYVFWCSETILAATFNKEIAQRKGVLMGNEALWGNGSPNSRIIGWYAPAVNIHRSPFSGRNFEYFGEDGYLSGMMSAYVIKGAQSKGLFCYVKHFGVNDQESNRCGLLTWFNEQSMREIYIRPFELCVKEGKTRAMMSSLNRLGYDWAGGSYELLTEILRNEWGFNGCVVTDSYSTAWGTADQMIRAGGNLALGGASLKYNTNSATVINALRNCAHGLLYAHANSMAMNSSAYPVAPKPIESFTSNQLKTAVLDGVYNASVATAVLSKELYPDLDDSVIVYTLAEESALPKGLTLSENGIISGTPAEEANNFRFTVNATYDNYTKSADFTISVINANGSIVYNSDGKLANATLGIAVNINVASAEIIKPDATPEEIEKFPVITYSLKDGSLLPEGLILGENGIITGVPSKECENYEFTVVAEALGFKGVAVKFTLNVYNGVEFTASVLKNAVYGVSYTEKIKPAETQSPYTLTYELKDGCTLPEGLTLTPGGYITGTPTETVTAHKFTVVTVSKYSESQEAEFEITVALAFEELDDEYTRAGDEFETTVSRAAGAADITYSLKEGSKLPEGLSLDADGTISGISEESGDFEITVVASADGKTSAEATFTLHVVEKAANNAGAIIGGSIAGVAVLAGAGATALFIIIKKKATADLQNAEGDN